MSERSNNMSAITMHRISLLKFVLIGICVVFAARLWYLQVLQASYYDKRARRHWVRSIVIRAPRGLIVDAEGRVLATNITSYDLCIIPAEFEPSESALRFLSSVSKRSEDEILKLVEESKYRGVDPIVLRKSLDNKTLIQVLERMHALTGVTVEEVPVRCYPHGKLAAHVLGYIGEVMKEELNGEGDLFLGDKVGRLGVEKNYDEFLRGSKGYRLIEVDATGTPIRRLSETPAHPGKTLRLTLHLGWQKACEKALDGRKGAIVVMDVHNGGILAMCSSPSFSPNDFSNGMSHETWRRLRSDNHHPLQNRAISGCYPPGSTFKIVTAIAALSEGLITPKTVFTCSGGLRVGRRYFKCWRVHGAVDLTKAIGQSCDVYFYRVGLLVGPERLSRYAHLFGFGRRTGIDLPGESRGFVPSPSWKERRYGIRWYDGDTANFAIGQGYLLATPLQMCLVACAIANNGIVYKPHLISSIENEIGEPIKRYKPEVLTRLHISPALLRSVAQGMEWAVYGVGGTARVLASSPVSVAGKTGSSQHRRGEKPHAWFIGYAPIDAPKVAFAVVVESSGHGGDVAAPIIKQVLSEMKSWFGR